MKARLSPRIWLSLLSLGAGAWTWAATAAMTPRVVNTTIPPAPDGERFLFVVDISSGMEDMQASIEASLFELIRTGVGGYMRAGDTYGIWTFNKETYTGKLPMQVWDPRRCTQLATIAAASINNQTYEKSSNVKEMMQNVASVVRTVTNLNVFVISDGATDMTGTPFDKSINSEYRKQNRQRKQTKRPFVTALVVRDGWFVNSSVRIAGQQIDLPERPAPLQLAQTNTLNAATSTVASAKSSTPAPAPAPPPRKVMQIVTKPTPPQPSASNESARVELAQAAPAADPASAAASPFLPSAPAPAPAPALAQTTPSAPAPATLSPAVPAPAPAATAPGAAAPPVIAAVTTGPVPGAQANSSPTAAAAPATTATSPTASTSSPPAIASAPPPSTPATLPPSSSPQVAQAALPATAPAVSTPAAATVPPPLPASVVQAASSGSSASSGAGTWRSLAPETEPLVVSARERMPQAPPPSAEEAPALRVAPVGLPSGVQALAPASLPSSGAMGWMLVFGAALLVVAALLLLLVTRRDRSHGAGSLITQSMERR